MRAPREVSELAHEANNYDFSTAITFRSWIHVAKTLLDEARIYREEQSHEEAYIMYARYANLVLNSMPTHPDLKRYRQQYQLLTNNVESVLQAMETLKEIINQQIEAYKVTEEAKQIRMERAAKARSKVEEEEQQQQRLGQHGYEQQLHQPDTKQQAVQDPDDSSFMDTLSSLRRLQVEQPQQVRQSQPLNNTINWSYPRVPEIQPQSPPQNGAFQESAAPSLPPKMAHNDVQAATSPPAAPHRPQSQYTTAPLPPLPPQVVAPQSPALSQRSDDHIEHKTKTYAEDGSPLRTVFLSDQLRHEFLNIAEPNTRRNLETCGILCGKLNRKAFFITHLVIPHQEATSDTCSTINEELLFEYVDRHDLFILGWIHTHPTQTCFLSSIDLHTQTSYQIMLPEAIAIVCSPQHNPSWGIFRLTDPPGVPTLKKCPKTSTFHPHPEPNLYKSAYKPGHVTVTSHVKYIVEDLRKKGV